jgi:predicted ribosome quality control (RQC) complex YloA/Tae2 family protein
MFRKKTLKAKMKVATGALMIVGLAASASGFTTTTTLPISSSTSTTTKTTTALNMGLFDAWSAGGSGKDRLDEEWEKQQEILANRRKPQSERNEYFAKIEKRRQKASEEQSDMWS